MYTIEDLYNESNSTYRENVLDYFVKSDYPNGYFLQQFHAPFPKPFCNKKYWEAFAQILVRRGLPQINDVIPDILIWWQDMNWPGFMTIDRYLTDNRALVIDRVKDACLLAWRTRDTIWLKNLLETFFGNFPISQEINDYLEEDTWKDFDKIYNLIAILNSFY